jgi:DNA uptake protein ComE-like DNA-binding protein
MNKLSQVSDAINEQLKTNAQTDKLAMQLAKHCMAEINKQVIPNDSNAAQEHGKGAINYARQATLEKLVKILSDSI